MSKKPIKKLADLAKEALDMSKEARMARAEKMGFDTSKTYYHGTPSGPFDEFHHSNYDGITAFFSENKNFADKFANDEYYRQRGVVQPGDESPYVHSVHLKTEKLFDHTNVKDVEALMKSISAKDIKALNASLVDGTLTRDTLQSQLFDGSFGILESPTVVEKLKGLGYDSMRLREEGAKNIAVFKPEQIRSVNAKFDPKKKGSGNILDSLGPIAVGAAGVGVASQDAEAKPLDMSKVARMKRAEELGFDTAKTYFHGTKGNISEFKVNPDRNGLGVYFSETPETANSYAMGTQFNSTGANVIPANLRQEKVFDIADKFKHEIVNPENKDKFLALFPKSARGPIEAKLREGVLPFGSNVAPAYYLMEQVPEVKKALTDGGYTSLRFNDWLNNKAEPVTVAFNPADIRSTNAAFDPKKKNSAKILAGGAGAATLAASNDALAADLNSPVASGMGEVASQAGHAMERFDAYTSNPFRKFLNSALEGKGIIQSAREGVQAFGAEKPTTGEEVAKNFLSLSPNQNLGFPTADGGKDYPLAGPLGVAVDFAVDPTNIPMAKAVGPSMDAASSISRIIEQSLLKRGLVLP